jgi:hypothetical protein
MGITRKVLSVSTLGLVDFRSDKERTARSSRRSAKYLRRQAEEARRVRRLIEGR